MKTGLDFFPLDVDIFSDVKIEYVTARFGAKGELCIVKLLCKIYREGYYTEWKEDDITLFAKRAGDQYTPTLVNEIVQELVKRGFFSKSLLASFNVLTSRGIQKRYFEAAKRRKSVEAIREFLLHDVTEYDNVNIVAQNVNISPKNDDIPKQSKVEQSKEKEILKKNSFDVFWDLYDKKRGDKAKLIKTWESYPLDVQEKILAYIPRYIDSQPNKRYRKDPSTFFNKRAWEDEIIPPDGSSLNGSDKPGYIPFVSPDKNNW